MLAITDMSVSNIEPRSTRASDAALRPGFSSVKTPFPIRYAHRWHRDGLIQLSLTANVTRIRVDERDHPSGVSGDFALKVDTEGGSLSVIFAEQVGARQETPQGLSGSAVAVIGRRDVYREPVCSTSRMIWATRSERVSVGDRLRILRLVSKGSIALGDLDQAVTDKMVDPFSVIGRLICEGDLVLDINRPIAPETIITRAQLRADELPRAERSAVVEPQNIAGTLTS